MEGITFILRGETGFFKKPDVNTLQYYTYGHLHKVALLGILGSILGLGGYHQQNKETDYPEFYEKLKDLKVSVCPLNCQGYIPKKIQVFNNSIGYASKEEGGNLIIREQWLEKPCWKIYLMLTDFPDQILIGNLKKRLLESSFVYLPYLGKNDHFATIEEVTLLNLNKLTLVSPLKIHSLFPKSKGVLSPVKAFLAKKESDFKYEEKLPLGLEPNCNLYESVAMVYSNIPLSPFSDTSIYQGDDKNLIFY